MKKHLFIDKCCSILNMQKVFYVSVLSLFLLAGCSNEQIDIKKSISVKGSTDVLPSYDFNWETEDFMPTPSDFQIRVPWFYGASGSICSTYPADVYSDYKKADGWIMLYNGFSPTAIVTSANSYFILYNRYRGLLRIYQYNPVEGLTCSSTVSSGITWNGNGFGNNTTLSFLGSDIVDLAQTKTNYYALEPGPQNGIESPVHPHKWYMFQYELAYDPSLPFTTSPTPPTLTWYVDYANVTAVKLNGEMNGKIAGTIGSSTLNNSLSSALVTGGKDLGTVGIAALGLNYFSSNKLGLPSEVYDKIKTGVASALSTATGKLPGAVVNILSGMFTGGSTSTPQSLKLDLSANLHLEGTLTNNGSLFSGCAIPFPGTLATNGGNYYYTSGLTPLNNVPLGVFNLSAKPTVDLDYTYIVSGSTGNFHQYLYTLDNNSFTIQWNPDVLSNATILNLTKEVVIKTNASNISQNLFYQTGRVETLQGTPNWWTGVGGFRALFRAPDTYKQVLFGYNEVYVRISFVVHPNNGAPDVAIVKTFKANKNIIHDTY